MDDGVMEDGCMVKGKWEHVKKAFMETHWYQWLLEF
jgi:hypothetical protein